MLALLLAMVPPVVYSPYVLTQVYEPAPLKDETHYVQTTVDCASPFYPFRVIAKGTVLEMIINPNGHPKSNPSVWGVDYQNNYLQGVKPLGTYDTAGFYLPTFCLQGMKASFK